MSWWRVLAGTSYGMIALICPSLANCRGSGRPARTTEVPARSLSHGSDGDKLGDSARCAPKIEIKLPGERGAWRAKLAALKTAPEDTTGGLGFTRSAPVTCAV